MAENVEGYHISYHMAAHAAIARRCNNHHYRLSAWLRDGLLLVGCPPKPRFQQVRADNDVAACQIPAGACLVADLVGFVQRTAAGVREDSLRGSIANVG